MGKWKDKSDSLREKCLTVEKQNMRLLNRIYHIKKMMKSAQKDRKAIMERLDRYNDDYRSFDTFFDADVLKDSSFPKPVKMTVVSNKKSKVKSRKENRDGSHKDDKQHPAPKKPVNAYLIYCQQTRNEILNEHPEISHQELTKLLAKSWNQLKLEQKQIYYEFYEQDKERYENELEEYTGTVAVKSVKHKQTHKELTSSSAQSNVAISPTLNSLASPPGLATGFPIAHIPSPTLTHDESSYRMTNIPSPSFH